MNGKGCCEEIPLGSVGRTGTLSREPPTPMIFDSIPHELQLPARHGDLSGIPVPSARQ